MVSAFVGRAFARGPNAHTVVHVRMVLNGQSLARFLVVFIGHPACALEPRTIVRLPSAHAPLRLCSGTSSAPIPIRAAISRHSWLRIPRLPSVLCDRHSAFYRLRVPSC